MHFYYSPDSKKAKFCADGNKLMRDYILKNSLSYNPCGKVVVSKNHDEDEILEKLYDRGITNNCDVKLLKSFQIKNMSQLQKLINYFFGHQILGVLHQWSY